MKFSHSTKFLEHPAWQLCHPLLTKRNGLFKVHHMALGASREEHFYSTRYNNCTLLVIVKCYSGLML